MDTLINSLVVASLLFFIGGVTGIFIKAFKEKLRLRYLFIASLLCFSLAFTLGWEDAVKAFKEGWNETKCNDDQTEQVVG